MVDSRLPRDMIRALAVRGYDAIALPPLPSLPSAIASHPDTLIFRHGKRLISTADYCDVAAFVFSDVRERCSEYGISFTADELGSVFPRDCILNAAVIGDKLFCKTDSISRAVLEYAERAGLRVVHTRQGYPACATLILDGAHAVTADRGLAEIYERHGIEAIVIEDGGISLPPYKSGFIGGASGVFGKEIFFIGDVSTHPSEKIIRDTAERLGFKLVSLGGGMLADLGGLIFLD